MLVYISHSPNDIRLCRKLKTRLEKAGHIISVKNNPLEFYSSLSSKGKLRMDLASMGIVLRTANGRASYRVHQEMGYMNYSCKDYFLIENNGLDYSVQEFSFGRSLMELNQWLEEKRSIRSCIESFIHSELRKVEPFIFHTNQLV